MAAVEQVQVADLPGLLGDLEAARATAWARLTTINCRSGSPPAVEDADENVSADDAARRLGMSKEWLYRNASRLPFAVRIGRRVLFSRRGLERWNRQQRSSGLT